LIELARLAGCKVALVSTAKASDKGSMPAYVEAVHDALSLLAPGIETEVIELAADASGGLLSRAVGMAAQHWRARRARRRAPDLWHVLDGSQAHLASALGGAPVVVTVHDLIPRLQDVGLFPGVPRLGWASRLFWRANARAWRRASALACDSAASARDAQAQFGVSPESCRVVPLALRPSIRRELEKGVPSERQQGVVLHVGNNGFYKNRRGAIEVFSRLDPAAASGLWMAGPAPEQTLRDLVDRLGLTNRVRWLVDPDDALLAKCYREASLMLFPSRYEGFGWPVLEAMAFGLPIVCSSAGSLPEVVGDAYRCHPADDQGALAEAAVALLMQPGLAAEASARGLRRAAEFTVERFASNLVATYADALSNGRKSTE
jgi:glycosyltransferase involved in cell wall biosynthesis